MDENTRKRWLAGCRLFSDLPEPELGRIAAAAGLRRYRRGQLLFYEGDPGDSMLVLVQGRLKAVSTSPQGEELLLAVLEPGEAVGELTVADGGTRSATIGALTDAVVLRLPRDAVLASLERSPALVRAMLESLAGTVRRLTADAADLVFLDTPRRVAKVLLALPRDGDLIRVRLTQSELAERVGASRQSVNAALQEFQRRGWITVATQGTRLRDTAAMSRFVG